MRRPRKILLWIVAIIMLLPVLAVATILIALNTAPGRTLAETQVAHLTGGAVILNGLRGRFPDRLRLAHLEVRDIEGAWLAADDVVLDWSPVALLHKQALIHRLEAAHLALARLPVSDPSAKPAQPGDSKPFTLPVRVTVERLDVPTAALGAPLLGIPAIAALKGQADLPTLETGSAILAISRVDAPGGYTLKATVTDSTIDAHLALSEPEGGLIDHLANLPALGALAVKADISGPRSALGATLAINAGPLTAQAAATIDLDHSRLTADINAHAPAMRPADGVAWQAIVLQAHVAGPFTTPGAQGHLDVDDLEAQGATLHNLAADLAGDAGQVSIHALATALRIPGPRPELLAAAPIMVDVAVRLDDPARPLTYSLSHPLIALKGAARTAGSLSADATLNLPDLAPLAVIANLDLGGSSTLNVHAAQLRTGTPEGITSLSADGTIGLTSGPAPAPALIGRHAHIAITAQTAGSTVTVQHASIEGAALALEASGSTTPAGVDATARLTLSNLALAASTLTGPTLTGAVTLDTHFTGPLDKLNLDAALAGDIGAAHVPQGPVRVAATLTGLPTAPAGRITGTGTLAGAPLDLALDATRDPAGILHATIDRADWRSMHAEGALTLPAGATIPEGRIALRFPTLADLRPLIGQPITGGIAATLAIDPAAATLDAELHDAGLPGTELGHVLIKARVADPVTRPDLAATLTAEGINVAGTTGSARIEANGPQDALALRTTAGLTISGIPAQITAAALLDTVAKQVRLNTLQVEAKPPTLATAETVRLLAPATIRYGEGVAVDRIRIGLRQAVLDVAGRLSPTLDATATLRAPADIAQLAGPELALDGAIALDARLTGTAAQPGGTIKLDATGIRARTGPGRAIPAATLNATAQLTGGGARIDARLTAGSANLAVNGQAPLGPGALALHATGGLDLALLDPILTAEGRRVRGRVNLDTTINGTVAAPQIAGQAQLANGDIQDFAQSLHLSALAATVRAEGQTLRIVSFTGRAGAGTIGASGTIGALAPGLPVDLAIVARNARPLASDTVTADLDANVTVRGQVSPTQPAAGLQVGGDVTIRHADLGIPSTLPASVAVLDVRRPGDKPPVPAAPAVPIGLDLIINAPGQIFVRGRGVDAELAGKLTIQGTSTAPQVGGGLNMRRGTVSVAGTTLNFSRGKVGFDGTGVTGKIDPTLDFAADSTASSVTATLAITGYVSKPKITFSSVPDLPQDEVLAYLLFKRSAKDLGPFQLAQIAAGLAELTGVGGGGGFNPLESVRKGLGLDRLSVGSSATSSTPNSASTGTPTVEAGRYVANGVYVGAKQGTSGNQTQATVQIDITKGLKLETDVGSGEGGNQVGVTYQFEY